MSDERACFTFRLTAILARGYCSGSSHTTSISVGFVELVQIPLFAKTFPIVYTALEIDYCYFKLMQDDVERGMRFARPVPSFRNDGRLRYEHMQM